jgi:hypothetical protein
LTSISGISQFANLEILSLSHNLLSKTDQILAELRKVTGLKVLNLQGNPCVFEPFYREKVAVALAVAVLDGVATGSGSDTGTGSGTGSGNSTKSGSGSGSGGGTERISAEKALRRAETWKNLMRSNHALISALHGAVKS